MNPSFLLGLMLSSALALAAADKNFQSAAVGRRGRQVLTGFRNGQALTNGAVVRKVLRRGRGQLAPTLAPALTPIRFAAAPAPFAAAPAPIAHLHHHAAPAPFVGPAPAPLLLRTPVPAPAPVVAVHHHGHPALPAIAPAFVAPPQLVAQVAAPQPLPAPAPAPAIEEEQVIFAVGRDQAQAPTLEYGAPSTVAPEVRAPVEAYGSPALEVVEVRDSYLPAEEEVVEVRDSYLPAVEEVVAVRGDYGAPAVDEVIEVRDSYLPAEEEEVVAARDGYGAPAVDEVVEVRQGYLAAAAEERAQPAYTVPRTVANVKSNTVRSKPINIIRSHYNPPAETSVFDYSFESENGIKQEATGTMRLVDDTEVSVMKGSYSYIGADGVTYTVDWYADETGFHASAPHLPKAVEPNHPEVAAAVRAQIAFAAEEDAAAAARGADSLAGYGSPAKGLPSYA